MGIESVIEEWPASDKTFKALLLIVTLAGFFIASTKLDIQSQQLKTEIELNAPIMGWVHESCPRITDGTGNGRLTITDEGNSPLPFEFKISGFGVKVKLNNVGVCQEFATECRYGFGSKQGAYYVSSKGSKNFDYTVQAFGSDPSFTITLTDLFRNISTTVANCEYQGVGSGIVSK